MKKLLALFVLLAVLGLCMPSYGYVLIYKLQIYGKAVDLTDDAVSSVEYGKVKAYMVLEIQPTQDEETPEQMIKQLTDGQSAEIVDSELIIYDRYKGPKFYVTEFPEIELILTPQPDEELAAITIRPYESGQYQANLVGKLKMTDVGLDKKVDVPQSLAGSMLMNGFFFDEEDIIGATTVTGTLEKKLTKIANQEGSEIDPVEEIIIALEDKGFEPLFD